MFMGFGLILKGYESKLNRVKTPAPIIEQSYTSPFSTLTFCKSLGINRQDRKNACLHKFGFKENKRLVKIGVLDTGIDSNHYALQGYISPDGLDSAPLKYDYHYDKIGHGTHVAGIIISELDTISELTQQTFNIEIVSLKYDHTAAAPVDAFPILINKAIELNIDILNISSNGEYGDRNEFIALYNAASSGMEIIAAAGNQGVNLNNSKITSYPCSYPIFNITCVGNLTDYDGISPKSNYGNKYVHVLAYGTNVVSTLPNDNWGRLSGTSQSAPRISAFAVYNLIQFNKKLPLKSGILFHAVPDEHVLLGILDYSKLIKDNNKNFNNVGMVVKDGQQSK